jgi:glycosyltransferase involved in cell wall biosynthesis
MKICIIVHDLIPYSLKASAKMIYDLAQEAVRIGHEVTVILPAPDIEKNYEIIQRESITIYRFKSGRFENAPKIQRAIAETLFSFRAWKNLKKEFESKPHDCIIYYSPSIFWGGLVKKLKKLWKVKAYLVLRDFFPQWAIDNGMIGKNSLIAKYFLYFEKLNYNSADYIGIQSPNNLKWFLENKKVNAKTEVLFNWVSDTSIKTDKTRKYRNLFQLQDKILIVYGGNMGPAQDMKNVIELSKRLSEDPQFHFLLVGSGYEVETIKSAIANNVVKNITYSEPITTDEYLNLLAEADIGLFCLNKNHKTHNFPGKILGYLVQGLPVLGAVNPGNDLKDVIESANAGYISIAGDHQAFYENAKKLKEEATRKRVGKNARGLMENTFSVRIALSEILKNSFSGGNE